jgi:hypothetical protein
VKEATVGITYVYQVSASDPDGDTMTYGITSGPQDMLIDPSTGRIMWIPTKADVGKKTITVYASDGLIKGNQTFELTVKEKKTVTTTVLGFNWWIIIIVAVIAVLVIVVILATRKKSPPPTQDTRTQVSYERPMAPAPQAPVPPSGRMGYEERAIMNRPPERPVTHEVKGIVDDALTSLRPEPAKAPAAAPVTKKEPEAEEIMVPDEEPEPKVAPDEKGSTDQLLDDILGKVDEPKTDAPHVKAMASTVKEVPKAQAKTITEEKLVVEIEGNNYTKEQILHKLSSLPRGLPSTLWGREMDDLSKDLVEAEYSHTPDGDVIVKLGKKWYFGDPKDLGTYLQQFKGT